MVAGCCLLIMYVCTYATVYAAVSCLITSASCAACFYHCYISFLHLYNLVDAYCWMYICQVHTLSQKKTRHLIFYHNFGKCEPIFKILSQPYS